MPNKTSRTVTVIGLPAYFANGLPLEDQAACRSVIGHTATLVGYNEIGWAELEFRYADNIHTIWLEPEFIVEV